MTQRTNDLHGLLRQLPSVDALINRADARQLQQQYGRPLLIEGLRAALEESRNAIQSQQVEQIPGEATLIKRAQAWLEESYAPTLVPVINASGVIVHTNLGRAPLSQDSLAAIKAVAGGYSNLEYDIEAGRRGSRLLHATALLSRITGAQDALVVNNNAAAVLLMLSGLCKEREVIISRGQLVEIGGGFRIPDVMAQSGARLVEVGTTNRTHLRDYARAITSDTAAIMVAHHSNYQIIGFAGEPSLDELAPLAEEHHIPLLFDQGSGALLDVTRFGLHHELTVAEALEAGASLVAFSGDKLLGGPQAGILCGRSDLIRELKSHPLARAMRADKTCLAGLAATLTHYLRDEALQKIPVWQMIGRPIDDIASLALSWVGHLSEAGVAASVVDGHSRVGGGSLPGSSLPTKLVAIAQTDAERLAARLRTSDVKVIGRIQDGLFLLDPRTVFAEQASVLLQAVIEAVTQNE